MRRKDREIADFNEIAQIIAACDCFTLVLSDEEYPYPVTLNFGESVEDKHITLYFHCAKEGKKLDLIRRNPKAAFTMHCNHNLIIGEDGSKSTMEYESVSGRGTVSFVAEDKRKEALNRIMAHYAKDREFDYNDNVVAVTELLCIDVEEITGKRNKVKNDS